MSLRVAGASLFFLGASLLAGCVPSFPDLTFQGPSGPLAVGSEAHVAAGYTDSLGPCAAMCKRVDIGVKEHLSVESSDPSVLEVVAQDDGGGTVRARHAGTATLTLTALNTMDVVVVEHIGVEVLDADRIELISRGALGDGAALLPVDTVQIFDFHAWNGDRELYANKLPVEEDTGALAPELDDAGQPVSATQVRIYHTPKEPTDTAVTLSLGGLSTTAHVRIYDLSQVDGFGLTADEAGPYPLYHDVLVRRRLEVGGTPVGSDPFEQWPMSVKVETPDVCYLPDHADSPEALSMAAAIVRVWGTKTGTCKLSVKLDGTEQTATLELPIEEGAAASP